MYGLREGSGARVSRWRRGDVVVVAVLNRGSPRCVALMILPSTRSRGALRVPSLLGRVRTGFARSTPCTSLLRGGPRLDSHMDSPAANRGA